jgi:hypothetical protein
MGCHFTLTVDQAGGQHGSKGCQALLHINLRQTQQSQQRE